MRTFSVVFSMIFFLLTGFVSAQNVDREGIVGRVVDANGRPVAYADITYSDGPNDDMLTGAKADAYGRFELKDEPSPLAKIWIRSKIDSENWLSLISPGVNLTSKYQESPVIVLGEKGKQRFVDLGDVLIQVYYSPFRILIRPEWRERIFSSGDWISFRVIDKDGLVASDFEPPIKMNGINKKESSITIALPVGKWKIEMSTEGMPWKVVAKNLIVTRDTPIKIDFPSKQ